MTAKAEVDTTAAIAH